MTLLPNSNVITKKSSCGVLTSFRLKFVCYFNICFGEVDATKFSGTVTNNEWTM